MFAEFLAKNPLEKCTILAKETFHPFVRPDEQPLPNVIGNEFSKIAVQQAEYCLGHHWEELPATLYMEFVRNGDRSRFEDHYFRRRNALFALLKGEIIENKGRFIDDIINGVWAICEESSWVVPAHNNVQEKEWLDALSIPEKLPYIDLFAAETAALLAWVYYFLKGPLDRQSQAVCRRIETEVKHRILDPYLYAYDFHWMQITNKDGIVNNWNPWIHSNCLATVFILEPDMLRRRKAVQRALLSLDRFMDTYGEDGCCEEGPSYWNAAGGALFDALELLHHASGGCLNFFQEEKIKKMGAYYYKVYLGGDYYVNFSDAPPVIGKENADLIFRWGARCGDPEFQQFGLWLFQQAKKTSFFQNEFVNLINRPVFSFRRLKTLFDAQLLSAYSEASPPIRRTAWFPDKEVVVACTAQDAPASLILAAKGGYNEESHNHNDIGTFLLYRDGSPVIVDIGSATYCAKTFSAKRYEMFNNSSAYHCCPVIDGIPQQAGMEYRARQVCFQEDDGQIQFSLDIAAAYPSVAQLAVWRRTFLLKKWEPMLTVTEHYELEGRRHNLQLPLITIAEPEQLTEGSVRLGLPQASMCLQFDPQKLSVTWEKLQMSAPSVEETGWKAYGLWRVLLSITEEDAIGDVSYQFVV